MTYEQMAHWAETEWLNSLDRMAEGENLDPVIVLEEDENEEY